MKAITLLLTLLLPLVAWSNVPAQTERIHWETDINEASTLVFKNHYGNIRLRKTDDQRLVFHAVAQASNAHSVAVDFIENGNHIEAQVVFNNAENLPNDHRLDAVLIVPKQLALDIEIENGELSSKGLNNTIKARSQKSHMTLKTSHSVDLFSKTGDITLYAKSAAEPNKHAIQSHTGDVNVHVLTKSNAAFTAISGQEISSNDPKLLMTLSQKGRVKHFGNPEAKQHFKLQTDTGHIRIITTKYH